MSFDLYLLPITPTEDFETAMELFSRFEDGNSTNDGAQIDVRSAAEVLREIEPRYIPFNLDYSEIARFEKTSIEQAKAQYNYVELNGPDDENPPLAQFIFHPRHVVVHWYSGTSEQQMSEYLKAIRRHAELSLVDPQAGTVFSLDSSGEFG